MVTDCWKAYPGAARAAQVNHITVNHSKHFKDPETGAHSNNVEGIHGVLKQDGRSQFGRLPYLNSEGNVYYLDLLVWRANQRLQKKLLFHGFCSSLWAWTNTPLSFWNHTVPLWPEEEEVEEEEMEEADWFIDPEEVEDEDEGDDDPDFRP